VRTLFARGGGAALLHHRIRATAGMVTAEFAIGMLAVVPLLLAVVLLGAAAAVKVQVAEGARTAARMLARGDDPAVVRSHFATTLPAAQIALRPEGQVVRVDVSQPVVIGGLLPSFTVTGTAVTAVEETLDADP
jgi:hypothetical protein